MITIYTNAKEINLTEEVTHVRFEAGYPYFWVRNDGENAVLISLSPNVSEGADGVISVPAGNADGTMHGYRQHDLYIKGSGKVMAMGTTSAHNPFKPAPKGGEISGAGLEIKVVDTLPETGESKYLYLVPKADLTSDNIYDEYVWTDGKWEKIGTTETGVTDYTQLENKPSINGITLNENKSLKDLGINNFDGRYTSLSSRPMCWSDLGGNFYGGVWIRACTIQPLGSFPIGSFSMLFFVEEWQQDSYVASITFSERNESNIKILSSTKNILQHLPKIRIVFNSNVIHVDVYYAAAIDHVRFSVLLPPGRLYVSSFPFTYNPSANGFYVQEFALKRDTVTVDTSLSETSENPVQNKVVAAAVNELSQRISLLEQKE